MAALGRVETDGKEPVAVGQRLADRPYRSLLAQMPQKTEDEATRDAELGTTVLEGAMNARYHRFERHASIGVGLRVEEDRGVAHPLLGCPRQVRPGEVVEILLHQEHAAARVIDVEKRLQVAEDVGAAN